MRKEADNDFVDTEPAILLTKIAGSVSLAQCRIYKIRIGCVGQPAMTTAFERIPVDFADGVYF